MRDPVAVPQQDRERSVHPDDYPIRVGGFYTETMPTAMFLGVSDWQQDELRRADSTHCWQSCHMIRFPRSLTANAIGPRSSMRCCLCILFTLSYCTKLRFVVTVYLHWKIARANILGFSFIRHAQGRPRGMAVSSDGQPRKSSLGPPAWELDTPTTQPRLLWGHDLSKQC